MRLFRGRASTIEADRLASRRLLSSAGDEPAVRVWRPHRQVAFGRRDVARNGYDRAREAARFAGFPPIERDVGGRAVAYDGETTLAFARADPVADPRRGLDERYERATAAVERALSQLGLETIRDEPPDSFCPGARSLSLVANATRSEGARTDGDPAPGETANARKVVGIAQRVRQEAAVTAGIVVVDGREELADVLGAVYDALGLSLEPDAVGSIATAGGPADTAAVRNALETELAGDESVTVRPVSDLLDDSAAVDDR
ncbi:lipoyl protein ligase domain-containing protein [Natrarchaeobius oligotrophus]|uniref:Lipoate--protein ligase family protein n=1 Tax=Natrarchaeobius chitinivorans TaxID=1679083 RepID=A0A3N6MP15_NATCH|nr:lipoate--protein ligase family protein [Natrarchaeobius chitinivorans]RQH03445.1 lipoate--protein ligase family protein [Natrarchaeobius chitinivorans]